MDTYDPQAINLVIAGYQITGFMDGTPIEAGWDEERWKLKVGVDGETARARNRNEVGRIKFTLMQTSASNAVLSALVDKDEATMVPAGASLMRDNLGTTIIGGDNSFLTKKASVKFGGEIEGREWELVVPRMRGVVGSAL